MKKSMFLLLVLSLFLLPLKSFASVYGGEYSEDYEKKDETKNFRGVVGAGYLYGPYTDGVADDNSLVFPIFNFIFYDRLSVGFNEFSTYNVNYAPIKNQYFVMKLGIGLHYGRDEDDMPSSRSGLGDVDRDAMGLFSLDYVGIKHFKFGTKVRQTFEDDMLTVELNTKFNTPIGNRVTYLANAQYFLANKNYMEQYYSVTQFQADRSRFSVYNAESESKNLFLSTGVNIRIAKKVSFLIIGGVNFLFDDAKSSPIPEDDEETLIYTSVTYAF
jgi:outer membrane scaffolding protein for murein synthesis (MipA/OmpV family)